MIDPIGTEADAAANRVEAAYSTLGGISVPFLPYYATAVVYNEFEIEEVEGLGELKALVDVQFSIKYSWEGGIAGFSLHEGRIGLSVEVDDVTALDPVGVASFDLVSRDHQGDQAIELAIPALDAVPYDRNDDTASFGLKLRSGHTYRITFKAEAYGFPIPILPNVESAIRGWWDELSVTVDEDPTVQLLDLGAALDQHDADIKALLSGLGADLAEVKRLLNTPTGRRPEFPIKE